MKWYGDKEHWLMCEGAEEIQKGWKPKEGDWFYAKEWSKICIWSECTCFYKHYVWLPSQEDLQEMYEQHLQKLCDIGEYGFNVAFTFTELEEFLKTFFNLVTAGRIRKGWYPKSWVQFWLAFVMHELYQKIWNPETKKWEKTESQ